jgi:CRP-like cAMP-binding protein
VRAIEDVRALEISAERLRALALEHPHLLEHISTVVASRRAELEDVRAAAVASVAVASAPRTLLARIQRFLRLP